MKKKTSNQSLDTLSVFLRDKRLKAGISQGEVARTLGYTSPQFVSNWERGLSEPPIATLKKLASLYSVPLDEMFEVVMEATLEKVKAELHAKFHAK